MSVSAGKRKKLLHVRTAELPKDELSFNYGVCASPDGRLFVCNTHRHTILEVILPREGPAESGGAPEHNRPAERPISRLVAGRPGQMGHSDGPAAQSLFRFPYALVWDPSDGGGLIVADTGNHCIRRVALGPSQVQTIAGQPGKAGNADGAPQQSKFSSPHGLALDLEDGTLFVADSGNHAIRRVGAEGHTFTLTVFPAESGDRLQSPYAVCVAGPLLYVADTMNHRLLVVEHARAGLQEPLAIGRKDEPRHADGSAAEARFVQPCGLALDSFGWLLVADMKSHHIRCVRVDARRRGSGSGGRLTNLLSWGRGGSGSPNPLDGVKVSTLAGDGKPGWIDWPPALSAAQLQQQSQAHAGLPKLFMSSRPDEFGGGSSFDSPAGLCAGGVLQHPRQVAWIADAGNSRLRRLELPWRNLSATYHYRPSPDQGRRRGSRRLSGILAGAVAEAQAQTPLLGVAGGSDDSPSEAATFLSPPANPSDDAFFAAAPGTPIQPPQQPRPPRQPAADRSIQVVVSFGLDGVRVTPIQGQPSLQQAGVGLAQEGAAGPAVVGVADDPRAAFLVRWRRSLRVGPAWCAQRQRPVLELDFPDSGELLQVDCPQVPGWRPPAAGEDGVSQAAPMLGILREQVIGLLDARWPSYRAMYRAQEYIQRLAVLAPSLRRSLQRDGDLLHQLEARQAGALRPLDPAEREQLSLLQHSVPVVAHHLELLREAGNALLDGLSRLGLQLGERLRSMPEAAAAAAHLPPEGEAGNETEAARIRSELVNLSGLANGILRAISSLLPGAPGPGAMPSAAAREGELGDTGGESGEPGEPGEPSAVAVSPPPAGLEMIPVSPGVPPAAVPSAPSAPCTAGVPVPLAMVPSAPPLSPAAAELSLLDMGPIRSTEMGPAGYSSLMLRPQVQQQLGSQDDVQFCASLEAFFGGVQSGVERLQQQQASAPLLSRPGSLAQPTPASGGHGSSGVLEAYAQYERQVAYSQGQAVSEPQSVWPPRGTATTGVNPASALEDQMRITAASLRQGAQRSLPSASSRFTAGAYAEPVPQPRPINLDDENGPYNELPGTFADPYAAAPLAHVADNQFESSAARIAALMNSSTSRPRQPDPLSTSLQFAAASSDDDFQRRYGLSGSVGGDIFASYASMRPSSRQLEMMRQEQEEERLEQERREQERREQQRAASAQKLPVQHQHEQQPAQPGERKQDNDADPFDLGALLAEIGMGSGSRSSHSNQPALFAHASPQFHQVQQPQSFPLPQGYVAHHPSADAPISNSLSQPGAGPYLPSHPPPPPVDYHYHQQQQQQPPPQNPGLGGYQQQPGRMAQPSVRPAFMSGAAGAGFPGPPQQFPMAYQPGSAYHGAVPAPPAALAAPSPYTSGGINPSWYPPPQYHQP